MIAEIEIVAQTAQEALEASIDQTADKFGVNEIEVTEYFVNERENHFMIPGKLFRVTLYFETDVEIFRYSTTREGGVSYL